MHARKERQQVVDICVEFSKRGFLAGTGGNVALRVDAESFAVTPSATDYLTMTAEDVCVVRLADLARIDGAKTPSVETSLHARLLRRRPDVQCSIHTHQPIASACALLGRSLDVENSAARAILGPRVPMIGYMPSGTGLLANKVEKAIHPQINAYFMKNHGVLCCGSSVAHAMKSVEELEGLAHNFLHQRISQRISNLPGMGASLERVLAALAHS
jgi:L-fuculose-phosphate aldolase